MAVASITVMVVADDSAVRSTWQAQLSGEPGCAVVGAVAADDVVAAACAARPDVVVWNLGGDLDAALPHLADVRELGIPVLAVVHDDRDGIRALAHGASGLMAAPAGPDRVALAARAVAGGLLAFDPAVAGIPGISDGDGADESPPGRRSTEHAPVEALTRRELDVLRLMAQGLGNRQIAERLSITEHTAKFHVHTILGKLSTQSRTEAVVRAARLGLVAI